MSQLTVEQLKKMIVGAVSLAAATKKEGIPPSSFEEVGSAARNVAGKVLAGFQASQTATEISDNWRRQILWVDDRPDNNIYERKAIESMGLEFSLALCTEEALTLLSHRRFAAIISDMGRKEGPKEGSSAALSRVPWRHLSARACVRCLLLVSHAGRARAHAVQALTAQSTPQ